MTGGLLLLIALACAGLMGFAVQRGATCMVAAMEEIVSKRRANRLLAMLEASALVAGGLLLASAAGILEMEPLSFATGYSTVLGGAILGLGAFVARACVFGAIARLGSGQWSYAMVPPGFFLGCLVTTSLSDVAAVQPVEIQSPLFTYAPLFAGAIVLIAGWRIWSSVDALRAGRFNQYVWSPHVATGVIGVTFVIMLLSVGAWAYTDALAEAAAGMDGASGSRLLLFFGLLAGAIVGGWTAGRLSPVRPDPGTLLRCLTGGAMMGVGSMLVPGSNDGLILIGLPLLQPHAWLALGSMIAALLVALLVQRRFDLVAARPKLA